MVDVQGMEDSSSQVEGSQIEGGDSPALDAPEPQKQAPQDTRTPLQKHMEKIAAGEVGKTPEKTAAAQAPAARGADGKFQKPAGTEAAAPAQLPTGQAQEGEKAPYAPNYKYKVMDKELEIPEKFRALMTDAESEKDVRELFEKANGIEFVKGNLQREREMRRGVEQEYRAQAGQIEELREDYRRKDFDSFFGKLNIPFDDLLQYVHGKLSYEKLPPEQRQVLDAQRAAEHRALQLERQGTQVQQHQEQMLAQAVQHGLGLALARADVKSAADAHDTRVGKPGAFREEVIRRGEFYWVTQGKLIPPDQAVAEVLSLIGTPAASAQASATQAAAPAAQVQSPAEAMQAPPAAPAPQAKTPPVIPNVQGKTTSPLPTKPRSIAELKKLAAQAQ
jgi:hypothetical protein